VYDLDALRSTTDGILRGTSHVSAEPSPSPEVSSLFPPAIAIGHLTMSTTGEHPDASHSNSCYPDLDTQNQSVQHGVPMDSENGADVRPDLPSPRSPRSPRPPAASAMCLCNAGPCTTTDGHLDLSVDKILGGDAMSPNDLCSSPTHALSSPDKQFAVPTSSNLDALPQQQSLSPLQDSYQRSSDLILGASVTRSAPPSRRQGVLPWPGALQDSQSPSRADSWAYVDSELQALCLHSPVRPCSTFSVRSSV
jgi:hypothetical protein